MSNASKGTYYVNRTLEWLRELGYEAEKIEVQQRIMVKRKRVDPVTKQPRDVLETFFRKRDLWGGDIVARNADHLLWIQVKAGKGDIAKGIKQLSDGPWPASVGRWVVYWPRGRRLSAGPEIEEVK